MRVGVVGYGSIAKKHIAALRQIDGNVCVFALRHSHDAETIEGVENVYSYDELKGQSLDFIIISNPTAVHRTAIESLAQSRIPLFIEKPLFDDIVLPPNVEARSYVACNLRFLECLQFLKNELKDKRINEVNSYCGSYLPQWRTGVNWRECYSANKEMGGGVHIDLIHEIDYIWWLFGEPKVVNKTFRNVSSLDISAVDYANYVLQYPGFTASIVLNYYRRDYKRTLEVLTENETYFVNLAENSVTCNGVEVFKSERTFWDTYKEQMIHFLKNNEKFNDINEAYKVLKICLA